MLFAIPVLILAFSIVGIRKLLDQRSHNSRAITEYNQANDIASANLTSIKSLQDNLADLEKGDYTSREVLDALPSRYDLQALNTSIEKLVLQNGLQRQTIGGQDRSLQESGAQSSTEPVAIDFNISVTGSYQEIQDLIVTFERSIRPIQLKKMTISGEGSSMQANLDLVTYYQPEFTPDLNQTKEIK